MDRLAFNAAAAINEGRTARQMTTNELAHVATPGFKRSFEAAMLTLKVQGAGFESRLQPQAFSTDNINMRPGVIVKTGRDLDISMDEQAVMGVTAPNGELAFTLEPSKVSGVRLTSLPVTGMSSLGLPTTR